MNKPENRYFAITRSGTLHRSSGLTDALVFAGDEGYVWLDYIDPNADTLEELDSSLGIHPLSIEDCLNGDQLPKLDLFPTYSFMTFTAFEQSPEGLLAHELDVFISKRFLITAAIGMPKESRFYLPWKTPSRGIWMPFAWDHPICYTR